jgi:hypothetical protein
MNKSKNITSGEDFYIKIPYKFIVMKYILCLLALVYSETIRNQQALEPLVSFRAGSKRRRSGDSQEVTESETYYDVSLI